MSDRLRRRSILVLVGGFVGALFGFGVPATPARAALAVVGVNDTLAVVHDRTATVAPRGVLANDLNLLGATTASLTTVPAHGSVNLRSDGGYTYVPDPGYVGPDSFGYRPSGLLSTGARVNITVTNAAPVARNDAYSTPSRTTLVVPAPGVLANDTDADGDALFAELDGGGVSGSLDLDANGGFRFSPGGGFQGSQTFRYRVSDGVSSSTATVTLTVAAPTPPPTPTPTPTPTPKPTPTATPQLPLPPGPLPSLRPLPSIPLPTLPSLGSVAPRPTATPSIGSRDPMPATSAQPSPGASASDRSAPSPESSEALEPDREAPGGEVGGGTGGAAPAEPRADTEIGGPPEGGVLTVGLPRSDSSLDLGQIDMVVSIGTYAVPAAILAGPGVLLLLWIVLQTVGAAAWIPAVRRLRGRDEPRIHA